MQTIFSTHKINFDFGFSLNHGHSPTTFILQSSFFSSMDHAYKLLFYLIFIPLHSSAATNDCPTSYCGQSFTDIRFPFRLINKQPENCSYPGFNLRCAFPSMTLLNLPTSGEFAIRNINYRSQTIRLYDPMNCLPARLLTFDLLNSPFSASYYQNFTLFSCPNERLNGLKPVECLSNSSFSILASDSQTFVTSMTSDQTGCRVTGYVLVPADQPYNDGFTSQLDGDVTLTWSKPDCGKCEASGGSCGYENSDTKMTKCFSGLGKIYN